MHSSRRCYRSDRRPGAPILKGLSATRHRPFLRTRLALAGCIASALWLSVPVMRASEASGAAVRRQQSLRRRRRHRPPWSGHAPADGFLHGIDADTSPARIAALRPHSRRSSGGVAEHALIAPYTTNISGIVSDYWGAATFSRARGGAQPPWQNWTAYRAFVTSLVKRSKQGGWEPAYWEIQNEPDSWLGKYFAGCA